jgi:pimeloyl-ACP methyl ester carboxylesterase
MHAVKFGLAAGLFLLAASASAEPAAPGERLSGIGCTADNRAVDAQGFVRAGGIEQWVTIRGSDCRNPAILFVHGGPGNPMSPFSTAIFGSWESDFTIVQWDQRGSGRTYGRNPPGEDEGLAIERMAEDGIAVAAQVAAALGQERLILVGTSWGSALAVHMALERPELFDSYVGISQLVAGPGNLTASYRAVLDAARSAADSETVAALEALGPPPWANPRNFGIMRRAIRRYEGRSTDPAPGAWWELPPLYATPAAASAYEGGEDYSYLQFVGLTGNGMLQSLDLPALGTTFAIPFFLVQGAEDLLTVPEVSRRYFESVSAPAKRFVLVPRTGHDPNQAMLDAARRLLMERASRR